MIALNRQTSLFCPISGLMAPDKALGIGSVTLTDFGHWSKVLAGRPGHPHLRAVRRLADGRRKSPLESRTTIVFDRWGWLIEPQFDVPGTNYRADGRIEGTRVLIECDGPGKYDEPGSQVREKVREDDIRAMDWQTRMRHHAHAVRADLQPSNRPRYASS